MAASNKDDNMTEVVVEQNNVSVVDGIKQIILRGKLVEIKESVINKIPYFETLFSDRFPTTKNADGVIVSNDLNPEIIQVIIQCVEINKFTDLFTLLPCDEHVVDLFDTLQFLCIQLPFVVDETILTHSYHRCSYKVSELNLIPEFEPTTTNYIIAEFAFNLFQMKNKKLEKEEKDKLVFLLILHLLLKDVDVKLKEHLRKFSCQVLELTVKQKHQVEQIDVTKQFDINVINAVLIIWEDTNFLRFYRQNDDPIQFFHLIKYLKLKLPFPTTQKYIDTYLTTIHDPLLEDEPRLEENTMTKLAYLLFINTNKLSVKTINNIINKACSMISVIKSHLDFVVCKHLKTIVTLYCPTVTYEQKARLRNEIGRLFHMFCCESENESQSEDEYYAEYSIDNEM